MLPTDLLTMKVDILSMFAQLGSSFVWTMVLFAATLLLSLPLGLLVAFARMSRFAPLRWLTKLYISVMRGTPLMLQLMVVYFGPHYLFGMQIGLNYRFWAAIIGFTINYAAYFAEIYRGGIESIPKGQYEAAAVLGFGRVQTFFRIIFPQVLRNILPSVTNEVITLVKDTSLAQVISYTEMFGMAKKMSVTFTSIVPYFAAGAFYYVTNLLIAFLMERLERRMDYTKR